MNKAFPPREVLISKEKSFNFFPSVCIWESDGQDMEEDDMEGSNSEIQNFSFVFLFDFFWFEAGFVCKRFN